MCAYKGLASAFMFELLLSVGQVRSNNSNILHFDCYFESNLYIFVAILAKTFELFHPPGWFFPETKADFMPSMQKLLEDLVCACWVSHLYV